MELSVVIPAYNEEGRLEKSLSQLSDYLSGQYKEYEIIVVDDGSLDGTRSIVEKSAGRIPNLKVISNSKNMGKGYSVKKGVLASSGDIILFSDADLSTPIDQVAKLERVIREEGYDIAIGSRAAGDSVILKRQNILREYMGKIFNMLVHLILMKGIRDTQCGFKLFKRDIALDIFSIQKIDGFSFDAEILYIAKKRGYRIKSVPIIWSNSPNSRVKLLFSSLDMFFDLIRIRRLHGNL